MKVYVTFPKAQVIEIRFSHRALDSRDCAVVGGKNLWAAERKGAGVRGLLPLPRPPRPHGYEQASPPVWPRWLKAVPFSLALAFSPSVGSHMLPWRQGPACQLRSSGCTIRSCLHRSELSLPI